MPRREKWTAKEKVEIVEAYLTGKVGQSEASRIAGAAKATLQRWVSLYKAEGPTGLLSSPRNRAYSKETKQAAVADYISGKGSLQEICERHKIRSRTQLMNWLKVYNRHEDFRIQTGDGSATIN